MPLDAHQLKQLNQLELRAHSEQFTREDRQLIKALVASYIGLVNLLKDPDATLDDAYQFLPDDEHDTGCDDDASDRGDSLPDGRGE